MNRANVQDESAFHGAVDAVLAAIETSVETALEQHDLDVDSQISGGILTLSFENHSKVIVNRQAFNREIWVAAKSGGFHFRLIDGVWQDTRSGEPLATLLSRVISEQAASVMSITL
jgi:CyaY protein